MTVPVPASQRAFDQRAGRIEAAQQLDHEIAAGRQRSVRIGGEQAGAPGALWAEDAVPRRNHAQCSRNFARFSCTLIISPLSSSTQCS